MRLLNFLNEGINDKGIFKAIHMGGLPAAGKTMSIQRVKCGSIEPRIVNTDKFTEHFKAYGDDLWNVHVAKIKHLTKAQLINYLDSLLPMWIDGTSASPSATYRRDGILKSLGYDTGMVWVNASLQTSLERASKRERPVPEEFIIEVYNKIEALKPQYKSNFKFFLEIDNNDGAFVDELVIKAYNQATSFFNAPLQNQIGKSIRDELISKKLKYLTDLDKFDRKYLDNLATVWYSR